MTTVQELLTRAALDAQEGVQHICRAGCGSVATTADGYCDRCDEEIDALRQAQRCGLPYGIQGDDTRPLRTWQTRLISVAFFLFCTVAGTAILCWMAR